MNVEGTEGRKFEGIPVIIQQRVNDVTTSDRIVPFVMCVGGIPGGNPTVKVAVILLEIPVDVLCEAVRDKSVNRLLDADLGKRRREECDKKQCSTDEHCDLGRSQQTRCRCAGTHSCSNIQPRITY